MAYGSYNTWERYTGPSTRRGSNSWTTGRPRSGGGSAPLPIAEYSIAPQESQLRVDEAAYDSALALYALSLEMRNPDLRADLQSVDLAQITGRLAARLLLGVQDV